MEVFHYPDPSLAMTIMPGMDTPMLQSDVAFRISPDEPQWQPVLAAGQGLQPFRHDAQPDAFACAAQLPLAASLLEVNNSLDRFFGELPVPPLADVAAFPCAPPAPCEPGPLPVLHFAPLPQPLSAEDFDFAERPPLVSLTFGERVEPEPCEQPAGRELRKRRRKGERLAAILASERSESLEEALPGPASLSQAGEEPLEPPSKRQCAQAAPRAKVQRRDRNREAARRGREKRLQEMAALRSEASELSEQNSGLASRLKGLVGQLEATNQHNSAMRDMLRRLDAAPGAREAEPLLERLCAAKAHLAGAPNPPLPKRGGRGTPPSCPSSCPSSQQASPQTRPAQAPEHVATHAPKAAAATAAPAAPQPAPAPQASCAAVPARAQSGNQAAPPPAAAAACSAPASRAAGEAAAAGGGGKPSCLAVPTPPPLAAATAARPVLSYSGGGSSHTAASSAAASGKPASAVAAAARAAMGPHAAAPLGVGGAVEVGLPSAGGGGPAQRLCLPPLRRVAPEGGPPNALVWEAFHQGAWQPVANTPWSALTLPARKPKPAAAPCAGQQAAAAAAVGLRQ